MPDVPQEKKMQRAMPNVHGAGTRGLRVVDSKCHFLWGVFAVGRCSRQVATASRDGEKATPL